MCGRFSLTANKDEIETRFNVKFKEKWTPNFNAAPTQLLPIITSDAQDKITVAKWGLVPAWAKDHRIGYKMINARCETVLEKPSYKNAVKKRRCLVLADGFYEWKKSKECKTPFRITTKKADLFAMAGIYEYSTINDEKMITFSILTTKPNTLVKKIHDRMPVVLSKSEELNWLNFETEKAVKLLNAYPAKDMKFYEVDSAVGSVKNNNSTLIKAI